MVTYGDEDEAEPAEPQDAVSPLWPAAADGRSGMRGKPTADESSGAGGPLPYRLLSPMGATAYGRAYRALHAVQNREVAVHYLALAEETDAAHAADLPLLVAKCAQLSHFNVIAVEEHGRDRTTGAHFVVTEPLEGASLATVLEDLHTLPLPRVLAITLQMGRALRAAHKLGIAHGALAPVNVRLVASDHGERVRVVGFGALMLAPPALRSGPATDSEAYRAPESVAGQSGGVRADVFAMASLLFHMLSGAPPPRTSEVPRLSAYSDEPVPRELEELIVRCLEPNADARVDVVAFVRELREIARSIDASGALEGRRSSPSESSLPPAELPPAEGESSGSLFGAESLGGRHGWIWILFGLVVALAAVWLLWRASARGPVEAPSGELRPTP